MRQNQCQKQLRADDERVRNLQRQTRGRGGKGTHAIKDAARMYGCDSIQSDLI